MSHEPFEQLARIHFELEHKYKRVQKPNWPSVYNYEHDEENCQLCAVADAIEALRAYREAVESKAWLAGKSSGAKERQAEMFEALARLDNL